MKQKSERIEIKETYVAPLCECIEISSEGILCASGIQSDGGRFGSDDDFFMGEW